MNSYRVGIDIGGTKTHAVVIDDDATVLGEWRCPTGSGDDAVVASALEAVRGAARAAGIAAGDVASIGVGVPGAVDPATGVVSHAVNLGVVSLPLGARLGAALGTPVRVENDVNAAAVGAATHFPGTRAMAYLNLGTGLAAGLVVDGRLWRGSHGVAGEIGHIPVDPAGPECRCGQRGCLETLASGAALARMWPGHGTRAAEALFDGAARGEPRALEVRDAVAGSIAAAVRILVLTLDADVVVLGGGMSAVGAPLRDAVVARCDAAARRSSFLASLGLADRVALLAGPAPVAAVGAALVGRESPRRGVPDGTEFVRQSSIVEE